MTSNEILKELTLEQKCALLSGGTAFGTRAVPSAGIPAVSFSDGPHGLRRKGSFHCPGMPEEVRPTCFPPAVTLANSWDEGLVARVGESIGEEAAAAGVDVVLGPGVCIKRSPLCGRNFEYFSEDPYLAGKMAAAYVRGMQSTGTGACVKHFAANSQETRRQVVDSVVDERTLREIYLTAFEIVVREAHPKCVMSSYNPVNGTYANENAHLLADILRGEWGFRGAVVSDWGGSNDHVAGVRAGSTLEMPGGGLDSARQLYRAVRRGELSRDDLDARVAEAVDLALACRKARGEASSPFDVEAHRRLAREAAASGIVLLKNQPVDGGGPLLPLAHGARVALVGDFADAPRYQGVGSSCVPCDPPESLRHVMQSCDDVELVGYARGFRRNGADAPGMTEAAAALAKDADVVVCCLGLPDSAEVEGADRRDMRLPADQVEMLRKVAQANPNVVVVLSCGAPLETAWAAKVPAFLYTGLGGQEGAQAVCDALTGRSNPSGKLAESWPIRLEDTPSYGLCPSGGLASEYLEGPYVGYRYYASAGVQVAFPFGFGLSYTAFSYSDLAVAPDCTEASFTVANAGDVAGAEVSQLYVSKPNGSVFRPVRELKGFAKTFLEPGESRRVTIALDDKAFRYFNVRTGTWEVEGGQYAVSIGASSEDIRLSANVEVSGTGAPCPYEGVSLPHYENAQVKKVDDWEFARLLSRVPGRPGSGPSIDRNLCLRDARYGKSPALWAVSKVLERKVEASCKAGNPDSNAIYVYNMPLRAIAKNAGQVASMGFVDALVREARGWGMAGALPAGLIVAALCEHSGRTAGDVPCGLSVPSRPNHPVPVAGCFAAAWLLWAAAPLAYEAVLNVLRNARDERILARQGGGREAEWAGNMDLHHGPGEVPARDSGAEA